MLASLGRALAASLFLAQGAFAQSAEFVGAYTWSDDDPAFGGISALEVLQNGAALVALGDRGFLVTASIARGEPDAAITSVTNTRVAPLRDRAGAELPELERDSEGLALTDDGRLFVSFEGVHGVAEFDLTGRMVSAGLDRHPHFARMQRNSSLEALAVDALGRLHTAPERSGRLLRPFPVYRRAGGGWDQPYAIPRSEDYLLVSLDFGPEGRLYVLERALRGILFSTRVRSFAVDGDVLSDARVLLQTTTGTHENLEGLSVWRDEGGFIRLSMVSDDNYNLFLRTQIVEYRLPGS
ncbi:esterase-like activity of phytase family protein [Tropicimonas sp. S265A]|uniref:esterase-like activity of phytase family protein n=1 Tax=Tropicimonas sp. S265A TaxID=3415134 RepID=UPI003C7B8005